MTFRGAVVGCEPTAAGPKGLARWRKSASTISWDRSCACGFLFQICKFNRPLPCVLMLYD